VAHRQRQRRSRRSRVPELRMRSTATAPGRQRTRLGALSGIRWYRGPGGGETGPPREVNLPSGKRTARGPCYAPAANAPWPAAMCQLTAWLRNQMGPPTCSTAQPRPGAPDTRWPGPDAASTPPWPGCQSSGGDGRPVRPHDPDIRRPRLGPAPESDRTAHRGDGDSDPTARPPIARRHQLWRVSQAYHPRWLSG
jgi:hypothetical protein